jgi:hypothetical protein
VERALEPRWGARIVTALIVVAALGMMVWAVASPDRRRRRAVEELGLGADTTAVLAALGRPARCPAGALERLRDALPPGTSPAGAEASLRRLTSRTAQRWVFAPPGDQGGGCRTPRDATEMGIDHAGRVVWYVAGAGRTPLVFADSAGGAASP